MVVGGRELIDTLWNVNIFSKSIPDSGSVELIDTLWNVNLHAGYKPDALPMRINRYIMECKFLRHNRKFSYIIELIDTLWNVNVLDHGSCHCRFELIDTLWNVNSQQEIIQRLQQRN